MWTTIARKILRNRISFLILIITITLFFGYKAQNIEMSYQYAPLLPKDDITNIEYEDFGKQFGNEGNLMVIGCKTEIFFNLQLFKAWQTFGADLKNITGVKSIFSVSEAYELIKDKNEKRFKIHPIFNRSISTQYELDSLKKQFHSLPFYKNMIYNPKTDCYLMSVTLDKSILESKERVELIKSVKKTCETFQNTNDCKLHISGLPFIRVETAQMIKKELNIFVLLALLITAIIIYIFFKSFKIVLFAMVVVGTAVIWALGIQALFGFKITILTGMIPPLIIVIGIPNTVFLLNKYHQEYVKHGNKIKALQRVIRKIGNATFLTNLTTAAGFATFIFTSSRILIEFGIIAAINIMVIFILSIILIPIIFSFISAPSLKHTKHLENKTLNILVTKLVHISLNHRKIVYTSTAIILLLSIIGIINIKTTGFMLDDIPHDNKLYQDLKFFERNFDGLMPLEIVIDTHKKNGAIKSNTLNKINNFQEKLSSFEEISPAISLTEVVKFAKQAYYNGKEKYYLLPNNQERNFILSYVSKSENNQQELINSFIDSTKQRTRISFRMADIGTTKMDELNNRINSALKEQFPEDEYDTTITGASVVFFKGTTYLINNLITSLILAIIIISSFMAWMFSSKKMVLVSLIPNLIPLITTAALMGYFGIPIKPSTILIFSIAFGISVDDTIHFLAKYRQELEETNWSIRAAVVIALKETGMSMIYTSVILFFGFGIFAYSDFGGTVALGILIAVTLLIALLSNLILLPTLLLSLERIITNKSFKEPLLQIYNEDEDIEIDDLQINKLNSNK